MNPPNKQPTRRSRPAARKARPPGPAGKHVLRLFVAGATVRSHQAIQRVQELCATELKDLCELEVIDIYQQPAATKSAQIVAVPTLIKELPFPPQRFVGDMSNTERIVVGLHLQH